MPDVCDRAAEYAQTDLKYHLQRIRSAASKTESARVCEDCGEKIPEARRRAVPGVRTCIRCQEERER